jgi:SPX domain protein involved in polyphosphate accumulation
MKSEKEAIRKFNRVELKYLLTRSQALAIQEDLLKYLKPDSYGDGGGYALSSLYYDSPEHTFYWEKIEGIKFRRKLRIRHYETADELLPETDVFVEIKQRLDRVVQKRRIKVSYEDALRLCNDRKKPQKVDPQDEAVLEEIQSMLIQYDLQPSVITSYFRQAFVGTDYDLGLRVTFDTDLRYRAKDLRLDSKNKGKHMLGPERVIMEVKANENVPYWLSELIGKHNISIIRVSKYCQGLQVAEQVPSVSYSIF